MLSVICIGMENECPLFDFKNYKPIDYLLWKPLTDKVRGGKSSASISNITIDGLNMASFEYNLVPLPSGACFAGVNYLGSFNASSYDGVKIKLRRTGKNEWFKVIFMQNYSYEYFFKASDDFQEIEFPFSGFHIYHWGKRVNISRPLDPGDLHFGLQTFGGVYEEFKQSGNGSLQIEWVKAYKA
ncbi:hypothetical protein TSMEX_007861 [Taenia solium]|eukprot:TsM_000118300 transcript=TsM_000118300 gene=TsM_000118300